MAMKYFGALTDLRVQIEHHAPYTEKPQEKRTVCLMPDAKTITLAEYDPASRGAITAHKLSDYRRKHFSLVLLPNVWIWLDELIKPEEDKDD